MAAACAAPAASAAEPPGRTRQNAPPNRNARFQRGVFCVFTVRKIWPNKSCSARRRQVEPALPTSHYRRLARLQFMAGQAVLYVTNKWNRHCRLRTIGDLPGSDLWSGRSCGVRRQQVNAGSACRIRTIGDLPGSDLWSGRSCGVRRQQVNAGSACRIRTIGDLPGSDLWSGRSCGAARQQVDAGTACQAQPASP